MKYNDMSQHLVTRKLMESACFLASDSSAVYINTLKPSIRTLFAFGKFGRLHNLVYDVDFCKLYSGKYGIYPCYTAEQGEAVPYSSSSTGHSRADYVLDATAHTDFCEAESRVTFRQLGMYVGNQHVGILPEFSAQVLGDKLLLKVIFPEEATEKRIHLPWYPIFDRFMEDGKEKYLEYYRDGHVESFYNGGFCRYVSGDTLVIKDSYSRQASVQIKANGGKIQLKSCTLPEKNNSKYLSTDVYCDGTELEVEITLLPQRDVIAGSNFYPCGSNATIENLTTGETISFPVPKERGEYVYYIGKGKDTTAFHYGAVPEADYWMDKAADACIAITWPEGKMKNVPCYAFDPTNLTPHMRNGFVYCSHASRIIMVIAAAAIRNRDPYYADQAMAILEALFENSYHGEDGSIYTPLSMDENGSVGDRAGACRPSDSGIVVRGLIYIANAYLALGMEEKAEKAVRYAWANVMTIRKMQSEDGEFYERFTYPDAQPIITAANSKGTVNNWTLQLWDLLPLLRKFHMDYEYSETERIVTTFIDSQLNKTPSILQVAGGGEDCAEFGDALNTAATLMAIKYAQTGDETYQKYAEDALLKAWALSNIYADMPGFFCLYGNSDECVYYDQPEFLNCPAGMHDLTSMEANLCAYRLLGYDFGLECATNQFYARLVSFFLESGGMYMLYIRTPNYEWKDPHRSESLNYGGVGVYAMALARKEISLK